MLCSRTNPSGCVCASSLRNMDAFSLDWLSRPGGDTNLLIMFVSLCLFLSTTLPPFWHVVDHILAKWPLYFLGLCIGSCTIAVNHVVDTCVCVFRVSAPLEYVPRSSSASHEELPPPVPPTGATPAFHDPSHPGCAGVRFG